MDLPSASHRWRAPTGPLVPRPDAARAERRIAAGLFAATAISVIVVHRAHAGAGGLWTARGWLDSAAFCAALLGILGTHELGHLVVGRWYGLRPSPPMFLPAPFFVGTLGAILQVRDRPTSRGALLATACAGPIAGFAAIVLVIGLAVLRGEPDGDGEALCRPLVWRLLAGAIAHDAPLTTADPLGYAAWVGCLVTGMNLLPFGQLDGGHVWSAIAPGGGRLRRGLVTAALALLGFAWAGWWAWLVAVWVVARREDHRPGGEAPWWAPAVGVVCVLVFAACFTVVPY